MKDNACNVILITKLSEHACCRSAQCKGEVDSVSKVDGQRKGIDNNKQPLADAVINGVFFAPKRNEHENHVKAVCVENCRGIKHQTAFNPGTDSAEFESFGKVTVVHKHVSYPCKKVDEVGQ